MPARTFAIGDIHGELDKLERVLDRLPPLCAEDTLLFIGDYIDRGPDSAGVVALVRDLPNRVSARLVTLRGNHEDAWLKVRTAGWLEFVLPTSNGCLPTYCSFTGRTPPPPGQFGSAEEFEAMVSGSFFPDDVIAWMDSLLPWWEDEHAIYVHAGLPQIEGRWLHPSEVEDPRPLYWQRSKLFFQSYTGKRVVFGHTSTELLPQELSSFTPGDVGDLFLSECLIGIDTGCGRGGFLSAIELPSLTVYDSR